MKYEKAKAEVIQLNNSDVITKSHCEYLNDGQFCWKPFPGLNECDLGITSNRPGSGKNVDEHWVG